VDNLFIRVISIQAFKRTNDNIDRAAANQLCYWETRGPLICFQHSVLRLHWIIEKVNICNKTNAFNAHPIPMNLYPAKYAHRRSTGMSFGPNEQKTPRLIKGYFA
jgi:hypothetical protein